MTRSTKARFGQVGDQVSRAKDQVGQGQGQELDNIQNLFLMKVEPNCPPSHSSATDIKITVDQWMNNTIEKQDTTDSSQDTNK